MAAKLDPAEARARSVARLIEEAVEALDAAADMQRRSPEGARAQIDLALARLRRADMALSYASPMEV